MLSLYSNGSLLISKEHIAQIIDWFISLPICIVCFKQHGTIKLVSESRAYAYVILICPIINVILTFSRFRLSYITCNSFTGIDTIILYLVKEWKARDGTVPNAKNKNSAVCKVTKCSNFAREPVIMWLYIQCLKK